MHSNIITIFSLLSVLISNPTNNIIRNSYIPSEPTNPGNQEPSFEEQCELYEIDIEGDWVTYYSSNAFVEYSDQFVDVNEIQYRTDLQHVVLWQEYTHHYMYLCRIVVNPIWKTRNWGFLGIGSSWDNWYFRSIKVSMDLPDIFILGDWAPKNEPDTITTIYLETENGDVTAGYSHNIGLDVISRTNVATNHFETEFYYPFNDNYSHYSVIFYTMFNFYLDTDDYYLRKIDFPTPQFETIYYGNDYFKNHTRIFTSRPFTGSPNIDIPST